ncbi:MAG: hypothetical protein ACRCXT_01830 [Paraclostridium sp.]
MGWKKNCGCNNNNGCEECHKLQDMAKYKIKRANNLKQEAKQMMSEAETLLKEAHMLECKAEECFMHCHHNDGNNYNCNGCNNWDHECNYGCDNWDDGKYCVDNDYKKYCNCGCKCKCNCKCKSEPKCKCKNKCK